LSPPPSQPQIYHITHVDNLESIARRGEIWSDGLCRNNNLGNKQVGMSAIKARRLFELEVDCHPGTKVGEYVPFYFCPRSIMLYLLYRGNHPDLTYTGGSVLLCIWKQTYMRSLNGLTATEFAGPSRTETPEYDMHVFITT
jgi:hypothetical protein